jgi:ribosomal protein S18 acetylase RimI-like enzyme
MNTQIREACSSDFEVLCTLFAEENRFHASLVPAYIKIAAPVLTQEELGEFLSCRTSRLFVCQKDDALLGAILVSLRDGPKERWRQPRRTGYIEDLTVTAAAQGQGIGKQLMQAAHDRVLLQGIQIIELHVWEANTGARHFYEALGLHSVQRRMVWEL